ncbi:MAG: hypothetical protein JST11_22745 [Acidobacteria bacterium]|nr:hypothetical protein [Acidobacteriota bacterium]
MIHRKTARGLALKPLATTEVGGFGTDGPADSTLALARSVALGALKLRDCLIEVGG